MKRLTASTPKCMLEIGGRPLLHHTMECLRTIGCDELVVVGGYAIDRLDPRDATVVINDDYRNNNILHSLMYAREHLRGPCVVSYSDIWVEPFVWDRLAQVPGDLVLSVDRDWEAYYDERSDHPVSQAENAFYDDEGVVHRIGKHLDPGAAPPLRCGEFLGLWRMSEEGTRAFVSTFDAIDQQLGGDDPFQKAAVWRKAYITDIVAELIERGHRVDSSLHERGWAELDTEQDVDRLLAIARRQQLHTLIERTSKTGPEA